MTHLVSGAPPVATGARLAIAVASGVPGLVGGVVVLGGFVAVLFPGGSLLAGLLGGGTTAFVAWHVSAARYGAMPDNPIADWRMVLGRSQDGGLAWPRPGYVWGVHHVSAGVIAAVVGVLASFQADEGAELVALATWVLGLVGAGVLGVQLRRQARTVRYLHGFPRASAFALSGLAGAVGMICAVAVSAGLLSLGEPAAGVIVVLVGPVVIGAYLAPLCALHVWALRHSPPRDGPEPVSVVPPTSR